MDESDPRCACGAELDWVDCPICAGYMMDDVDENGAFCTTCDGADGWWQCPSHGRL